VEDVEFRLGRGYRTRPLAQGCLALVVAAALFAAGFHMPALQWLAVLPLAYAAGSFAVCAWRGLVSTRLTARGIEIRRFRRRLVPWQAIRDIEDKVELIKDRWQQAVAGTAGHLDHPASY
jgi:hypothetical protein